MVRDIRCQHGHAKPGERRRLAGDAGPCRGNGHLVYRGEATLRVPCELRRLRRASNGTASRDDAGQGHGPGYVGRSVEADRPRSIPGHADASSGRQLGCAPGDGGVIVNRGGGADGSPKRRRVLVVKGAVSQGDNRSSSDT